MNMKTLRYIAILLAACTAFCSCEREDAQRHPMQESGRPIRFTTESVWPDITKAPITGLGDLLDDAFRVWGAWSKDPDDNSYFVGEYSSGTNGAVFGEAGTVVNAVDANGDDVFNPVTTVDTWQYENIKDWYQGYYSFAAVLPNSLFDSSSPNYLIRSASLESSFSKSQNDTDITLEYDNTLTVNFQNDRLNIGGHVVENGIEVPIADLKDIMFAFQTEDNSDNQAENVSLSFTHLFALLSIKLEAEDPANMPEITSVTVYGISSSIESPLILKQKVNHLHYRANNYQTVTENSLLMKGTASTLIDPFAKFTMPEGYYKTDGTPKSVTLFKNLMVFPEDLEQTPLQVKIEFNKVKVNDDLSIENLGKGEHTITIANAKLESGNNYVWSFEIDNKDLNGLK